MTLHLPDESVYRAHFVAKYTRSPLSLHMSAGTAPIYFAPQTFDHAFFESTQRDGVKDLFSLQRAQRMDDIAIALADPSIDRRAGWDSRRKCYDHVACVSLAVDDFVVIVRMGLTTQGFLRGKFVTCFVADNSIGKIRMSPLWDHSVCTSELSKRKKGR